MVYIDGAVDKSSLQMVDLQTGKPVTTSKWKHTCDISSVTCFNGKSANRYAAMPLLAFVDHQKDLWLFDLYRKDAKKLCVMVDHAQWSSTQYTLSAISEGKWICWYFPLSVFFDAEINSLARSVYDQKSLGQHSRIAHFSGSSCQIRKQDGSIIHMSGITPFIEAIHGSYEKRDWEQAIRLCRYAKRKDIWACLAGMAIQCEDLNTAEVAYAALEKMARVLNINYIKEISQGDWQKAELSLFKGQYQEAEQLFLNKNMVYRAIFMWIEMFEWGRALDLANRYRQYIDVVCFYRQRYLKMSGKSKEMDKRFLELQSCSAMSSYDEDVVREKIRNEDMRGR